MLERVKKAGREHPVLRDALIIGGSALAGLAAFGAADMSLHLGLLSDLINGSSVHTDPFNSVMTRVVPAVLCGMSVLGGGSVGMAITGR